MEHTPEEGPQQAVAQTEFFASAESLLDRLAPQHPKWEGRPDVWIFRGQAQDWPLLAKAHREKDPFKEWGVSREEQPGETLRKACDRAEAELVQKFSAALDAAGIEVPRAATPLNLTDQVVFSGGMNFPLLALAQHQGLPTRLLDWSREHLKATYFAAEDAARDPGNGDLVIWALRRDVICLSDRAPLDLSRLINREPRGLLWGGTPPQWSNQNLRAQAGIMTCLWNETILPVGDFLQQLAKNGERANLPWLRKFSAPRSCAGRLLLLLDRYGITGSSLFPGPTGVLRALKERTLWNIL